MILDVTEDKVKVANYIGDLGQRTDAMSQRAQQFKSYQKTFKV